MTNGSSPVVRVNAKVMIEYAKNTLNAATIIGSPDLVTLCETLLVETRTTAERWAEVRNEFQVSHPLGKPTGNLPECKQYIAALT